MRGISWVALSAAATVATAAPNVANATVVTLTFEGTVTRGIDDLGLFGATGADLAGESFSSEFQFNDLAFTTGRHIASGGTSIGAPDPTVSASITIGGVSMSLPAFTDSEFFQGSYTLPGAAVFPGIAKVSEFGPAGDVVMSVENVLPSLVGSTLTIFTGPFAPFDDGSLFLVGMANNILFNLDLATVSPITAPVSGIPEPSAWALMILGFAGVGAAMRRRAHSLA